MRVIGFNACLLINLAIVAITIMALWITRDIASVLALFFMIPLTPTAVPTEGAEQQQVDEEGNFIGFVDTNE